MFLEHIMGLQSLAKQRNILLRCLLYTQTQSAGFVIINEKQVFSG